MNKDEIQEKLIETGRKMVREQGPSALTARKLSEASGYSVGTIYNQFGNMDNYILVQNYLTLTDLLQCLHETTADFAYDRINAYADTFVRFVMENKNFWFVMFNFHLTQSSRAFSITYLRRVSTILTMFEKEFKELYPALKVEKRHAGVQVLWITLFALSSLLTTDSINAYSKLEPAKITKFLIGTYLTGLKVLEKSTS
ncbi:MAG: TetR/AcrR family transcriptional regulator [Alphaproteobacteria bacterium]|nr:TetR/AcrR family transcriptional regulator [Alphaproteobacteria bacterium]